MKRLQEQAAWLSSHVLETSFSEWFNTGAIFLRRELSGGVCSVEADPVWGAGEKNSGGSQEEGCGMEGSLHSDVVMQTRLFSIRNQKSIIFTNINP